MALAFPLSLADFLDRFPVAEITLDCPVRTSGRNQASGANYTFEEAEPIWIGSVQFATMPASQAASLEVLLRALEVPGRSFIATHPRQRGPVNDRGGAAFPALGGVTLSAVAYGAHAVSFAGLPALFEVVAGDRFSVALADGRRAMHEVQEAGAANAAGQLGNVSVWPYLRPGLAASDVVDFIRPAFKATIVPGSRSSGSDARGKVSGVGFSFMQNIR
jgi:hypothetical protein